MGECFMFGRGTIQPWAPDSTFANNEWKDIIKAVQKGVVPDTWAVGDQKAMTIGSKDYLIDIIGKNHDTYSDGSGTAPLTFQMHDCFEITYYMNSTDTTNGSWASCAMRSEGVPYVFALMPSEVQAAIKEVDKLTSGGMYNNAIQTTADTLFLPSETEVVGSNSYGFSGEGSRYSYYSTSAKRIKYLNGTAKVWWLRSPQQSGTNGYSCFCCVNTAGASAALTASDSYGVPFAFCF